MKMKLVVLVILCLLLSGCTIEYNLDIKNATYKESVTVTGSDSAEDQNYFVTLKDWAVPAFYSDITHNSDTPEKQDGVEYYDKKINERDFSVNLKYNFKEEEFSDSLMAKFCYNYFYATENDEAKTISYTASMDFNCFTTYESLEKVVVKLKSNRDVINHNADKEEDDTYIWEITKDNAQGKYIFFEMRQLKNLGLLTFLKYLLIVASILAIFGGGAIIYFRYRWKRANRI